MLEKKELKRVADVIGGQIMTRITAKEERGDEVIDEIRVVIPKSILSDGTISIEDLAVEKIKAKPDEKKLTKVGDIVIKLSTPYDAAIITEESAGCVVPSFCAIIRANDIDVEYLQAFLSTEACKTNLKNQVMGAVMSILSVGKIEKLIVPCPDEPKQKEIGSAYRATQKKIAILKRIVELESKKNNLVFKELCD